MNKLNIPDVTILAKLEQSLQQKIAKINNDAQVGIDQLSKRLDVQAKSNEDIASALKTLT